MLFQPSEPVRELVRAGLSANVAAGKVEALATYRIELLCQTEPTIQLADDPTAGSVRVVPGYVYLGALIRADGPGLCSHGLGGVVKDLHQEPLWWNAACDALARLQLRPAATYSPQDLMGLPEHSTANAKILCRAFLRRACRSRRLSSNATNGPRTLQFKCLRHIVSSCRSPVTFVAMPFELRGFLQYTGRMLTSCLRNTAL